MIRKLSLAISAALAGAVLNSFPTAVLAKSARACAAEYAVRGKVLGSRAAFLRRCTSAAAPAGAQRRGKRVERGRKKPVDPNAPPLDATSAACAEMYETNKAAIEGGGQTRAKFIKDCKNGAETIPGKTPAAAASEPAPTASKPAPETKPVAPPAPPAPAGGKPK